MISAQVPRTLTASRRVRDHAFTLFMWACGAIALVPLVIIAYYVVTKGWPALSAAFFTQTPAGPLNPSGGGISEAFVGTALIVGMACLLSIPLGVLAAVYLSEYGKGRFASSVRAVSEVLLSTPSIIAGIFIYSIVVVAMHGFSALAGALALTVLMWPVVARATEEILRLVPVELREGALALGLPRWKTIVRVVIPSAGTGILTAVMLAVARGLGETAPILLTTLGSDFMNRNIFRPTDAVPLRIYNYARAPGPSLHTIAWGGAVILLVAVLLLSIAARVLAAHQEKRLR